MERFINNYTSLKSREQKIYTFGGDMKLNGGSGIAVNTILFVLPFVISTTVLGAIVGALFNLSYNPLAANFSIFHTVFWIGSGLAIAMILYKCSFAGYKLYEYLRAYLRRKHVYANDRRRTKIVHTNIKVKATVKHIL